MNNQATTTGKGRATQPHQNTPPLPVLQPAQATRPLGEMGALHRKLDEELGALREWDRKASRYGKREPNLLSYAEWEAQQAIEKQAFSHRAKGAINAPGLVNTRPAVIATQNPERKATGTSLQ